MDTEKLVSKQHLPYYIKEAPAPGVHRHCSIRLLCVHIPPGALTSSGPAIRQFPFKRCMQHLAWQLATCLWDFMGCHFQSFGWTALEIKPLTYKRHATGSYSWCLAILLPVFFCHWDTKQGCKKKLKGPLCQVIVLTWQPVIRSSWQSQFSPTWSHIFRILAVMTGWEHKTLSRSHVLG